MKFLCQLSCTLLGKSNLFFSILIVDIYPISFTLLGIEKVLYNLLNWFVKRHKRERVNSKREKQTFSNHSSDYGKR